MGVEETRQRIVRATRELHQEVGPADTTITAIAERAGVQRLTVYRHFPDDGVLLEACSADWAEDHPVPDAAEWGGIDDPARRLRTALERVYGYFRDGAPMLRSILRDVGRMPELAPVVERWEGWFREVAAGLAAGWGVEPAAQRQVQAAVGHALAFRSWESLTAQGLTDAEAADLMVTLVEAVARGGGD